jgi:hypothetical protein
MTIGTLTATRARVSVLARTLFAAIALVLGCIIAGWAIMEAPLGEFLPLTAAVTLALVFVARWNFGAFVALLVLAVLNGIPGPDLEEFAVSGSFRMSDVTVAVLVVVLAFRQQAGSAEPGSLLRFARWWGIGFATWWLLTLIRSVADGMPLLKGALFGRDFLYFAILLPLLAGAFRDRREIVACLTLLAAAGVLHAVGEIAVSAGGVTSALVDLVVHTEGPVTFEGNAQRLYSNMAVVVAATFPLAIGLALIPPRRSLRLVGIGLGTLAGIGVLFQLTRATYLSLALALVVITATWVSANGAVSRPLRRASAALGAVVVLGLLISGFRPITASNALPSEASAVSERAASSVDELLGGTGNVGYRYELADRMLTFLDGRWPVGLGFWRPDVRPVSSLPEGSIRNADTGVLNAVMTIGVIGAALIYLPLVRFFFATMRRGRDLSPITRSDQWFFFGAATWILYVVASSASLVILFSVPGLVFTATILACSSCLIDWRRSGRTA